MYPKYFIVENLYTLYWTYLLFFKAIQPVNLINKIIKFVGYVDFNITLYFNINTMFKNYVGFA